MTLIIDAAPLVALADRRDPLQPVVRDILVAEPGELVIPAPVTAEADALLGRRIGWAARVAFIGDLAAGRFMVENLEFDEYVAVAEIQARFAGQDMTLSDAAVAVLAARYDTLRLLTFDQHRFAAIRPLQGGKFDLVPKRSVPNQRGPLGQNGPPSGPISGPIPAGPPPGHPATGPTPVDPRQGRPRW